MWIAHLANSLNVMVLSSWDFVPRSYVPRERKWTTIRTVSEDRLSTPAADPTPLVLVVDDDPDIRTVVTTVLRADGLRCETASDGASAVERALALRPQLVLLDLTLPVLTGDDVFARLRADLRTRYIPIVFLTAAASRTAKIDHLLAGGDDYVTKPFDLDELSARVQATLRRARTLGGLNPLSGLPGNAAIHEAMAARLQRGETFACIYLDIDSFKAFNDHYGFTRGDTLIVSLADSIFDAVSAARSDVFLGHIGGDDFVVLCGPNDAESLAADVVQRFEVGARRLHDDADVRAGGYQTQDRRGVRTTLPLASVSAGITVGAPDRSPSAAAVAQAAAEMKTLAKARGGGQVAVDRRRAAPARGSGRPADRSGPLPGGRH